MDRYVVIGNPVAHSKSPQIHRRFAAQTGESLSYDTLEAPLDGFAASVAAFVAAGGRGANVTVPFKEDAFRLATQRSARAESAGAVNTLRVEDDGSLYGDNTDGAGLVRDIEHNLATAIRGRRVLLLGAGGAARGVILPLLDAGAAELCIANRTAEKAVQLATLADDARVQGGGYAELAGAFDLIINATSAGLSDQTLPLSATVFAPGALAYDMVYGRSTPFMQQAQAAGARVADGLGMLVEQAAEAFVVWRGVRPDTAPVLAALRQS